MTNINNYYVLVLSLGIIIPQESAMLNKQLCQLEIFIVITRNLAFRQIKVPIVIIK